MAHESGNPSSNHVSDGVITGFGYSQGLNINGTEQLSIRNNRNIGIKSSENETDMDSEDVEKVKFLCSYNGKIMPRPSDGILHYVGGQTRIISVKKNVRFDELEEKMIEVYGQPIVIKYQLPDEDLDALVSVSCSEDIDNMMDEYEKLVQRSLDGSAKLRVFLFDVASEVDNSFEISQYGDGVDIGQRYVEAVNSVVVGGVASKESIASGSSNPNSEFSGVDGVDSLGVSQSDFVATQSATTFSPRENLVTYHNNAPPDPLSSAYVVPMTVPAEPFSSSQPVTILEKPIVGKIEQQQQGHDLQQPITITYDHHSPTYIESRLQGLRQPAYVHSPSHEFFPAAHMSMAPLSPQIGATPVLIKPVMHTQENRLGNYPVESNA